MVDSRFGMCASAFVFRRELHGTCIHSCDNPSLIGQLVSMLHKMAHSPHEPPEQLFDARRPCYCVSDAPTYQWVRPFSKGFALCLLKPVDSKSKRFLLLQDYHSGADGRVWLVAAASSGALGVIKFPKKHRVDKLLEEEAKLWQTIWHVPVSAARVVTVAGDAAMLLPFAFHAQFCGDGSIRFLKPDHLHPDVPASYLSDVDLAQLEALIAEANGNPWAVAEEAIRAMAEAHFEHLDVHWRHVAFVVHRQNDRLKRQAVLIDLGRVEPLTSADISVTNAAVARMQDALKGPFTTCANCGVAGVVGGVGVVALLKCAGCLAVAYCEKKCQKQHWSVHKGSCRSTGF
jgi:hypothetical protein